MRTNLVSKISEDKGFMFIKRKELSNKELKEKRQVRNR